MIDLNNPSHQKGIFSIGLYFTLMILCSIYPPIIEFAFILVSVIGTYLFFTKAHLFPEYDKIKWMVGCLATMLPILAVCMLLFDDNKYSFFQNILLNVPWAMLGASIGMTMLNYDFKKNNKKQLNLSYLYFVTFGMLLGVNCEHEKWLEYYITWWMLFETTIFSLYVFFNIKLTNLFGLYDFVRK